ncbi:MAG: hypothetical protein ACI83W_000922 [Marinoscillum sp.]|jgi:hypothetical protein
MKKYLPLICVFVALLACEPEEEQITNSLEVKLLFSDDTVLFDTLISSRTSITKRLRIYNPNQNAVRLQDIRLAKGTQSDYSMIVNGKSGVSIQDEILFGGDSLLILVDVTIDPQDENLPYLVKDSILVSWGRFQTFVRLVAYGQDANFINGADLCNETWTADRPYVIYNYASVGEGCMLTMEPGTRVYLDNGATMLIEGTLEMLGDSANRITVRNTRFDEDYREAPGQWNGIIFLETSLNNKVSFADIENGQIGLGVGYSFFSDGSSSFLLPEKSERQVDLTIDHTSIRHMATAGILSFSSKVSASNTEIYNAGGYLIGGFAGGEYQFEHCTFTNSGSFFINDEPMVQFSNNLEHPDGTNLLEALSLSINNSIIWGDGDEQLFISEADGASVTKSITSNIIKGKDSIATNYVSRARNYPGFRSAINFDYQLDSLAFARDIASPSFILDDLLGIPRDQKPDIGAFERVDQQ